MRVHHQVKSAAKAANSSLVLSHGNPTPAQNFRRAPRDFSCHESQLVISILQIAIMTVAEKIRYLRFVEGHLRGLGREMTQKETVSAIRAEMKKPLSQSYLSQLENGSRRHLTNTSRLLLAKFFKVHPGYLVDDPEGFQTELISDFGDQEDKLDLWLIQGAEKFRRDGQLSEALLEIARHEDTRKCVLLLASVLETPDLFHRLWDVLKPREGGAS